MNREQFDALAKATIERTGGLLISKGAEYAGDADRLANFKRNAAKNGTTVLECWQVYWGKHVDSINSYMARVKEEAMRQALTSVIERAMYAKENGKDWKNLTDPEQFKKDIDVLVPKAMEVVEAQLSEPIEGRFDDNINYSILCQAILAELRQHKGTIGSEWRGS